VRPPAQRQSALRFPLNELLGTEANVRLLRALAEAGTPLSASELARRTRLHLSGIGKAIAGLTDAEIIEPVGSGSRSPVQLRPGHPLAGALRELFQRERDRFDTLVERLRSAAARIDPLPKAVWIQGAAATGDDRIGDPIVIGMLAAAPSVERVRAAFEAQVESIERELEVTIEVHARTAADLESAPPGDIERLKDVIPLLGPPPMALLSRDDADRRRRVGRSRIRSHHDADARARALASAIADRLKTDPSLVPRARTYLARRLTKASAGEQRELQEWDRILRTMSLARLRRFLVDPGERATRLRQTLPFVGVLTAEERERLASHAHVDGAEDGRS